MRKFSLGLVRITPAAAEALEESAQSPEFFLARHGMGDWGEAKPRDCRANARAVRTGGRIISSYRTLLGVRIWIITHAADAHGLRMATTILLPEEY